MNQEKLDELKEHYESFLEDDNKYVSIFTEDLGSLLVELSKSQARVADWIALEAKAAKEAKSLKDRVSQLEQELQQKKHDYSANMIHKTEVIVGLEKRIAGLELQLADRTEKYKIAMDKGVDVISYQLGKAENVLKEFSLGESQWLDGVECMHKAREYFSTKESQSILDKTPCQLPDGCHATGSKESQVTGGEDDTSGRN